MFKEKMMIKILFVLLAMFLFVATGCNAGCYEDGVLKGISESNKIAVFGCMTSEYYRKSVIEDAIVVWEEDIERKASYKWPLLNTNLARLYMAQVLSKAVRSKFLVYNLEEVRKFGREGIKVFDGRDELIQTILLLVIFGEDEDVVLIEEAGARGDHVLLHEAVGGLAMMCNQNANMAAQRLIAIVADYSEKDELRQRYERLVDFKERTGHCDKRRGYLQPLK